jgi:uncharacterized protein YlaI
MIKWIKQLFCSHAIVVSDSSKHTWRLGNRIVEREWETPICTDCGKRFKPKTISRTETELVDEEQRSLSCDHDLYGKTQLYYIDKSLYDYVQEMNR